MEKNLKRFLIKSVVVLLALHLAYFAYGYFKFKGLKQINIYTEFYRFKFADDVSISHFFITGLFLLVFLILLLRNHTKSRYSASNTFKAAAALLLVAALSLSFFISYSFGMNARLRKELPEAALNKDKDLLNVLYPFLYNYTSYTSEKLFNPENILYPEPYPVIKQKDTIYIYSQVNENYVTEDHYYSIDTLKMLTSAYKKLNAQKDAFFDAAGLDKTDLEKRIISKKTIKDSTEVIFKGREVNPEYDSNICIFLENKELFAPINGVPASKQMYRNAVSRYQLLYKYKQDSLLHAFGKLVVLLNKYDIESQIVAKDLTADAFHYRDNNREPLNAIRNTFDRAGLKDKFKTLDRLFYKPNYLHPSVWPILLAVVIVAWLGLLLFYMVWNYRSRKALG